MTGHAANLTTLNGIETKTVEGLPGAVWQTRLGQSATLSLDLCSDGVGERGPSKRSADTLSDVVPELSVADAISVAHQEELEMQREAARAIDAKRRRSCFSDGGDPSAGVSHALSPEIQLQPTARSVEALGAHDTAAAFRPSPESSASAGPTLGSRADSISSRLENALFADSPEELPSSQLPTPTPTAAAIPAVSSLPRLAPKAAPPTAAVAKGGRGLRPQGFKDVPGFEPQGLRVAICSKKLPKTQSWCFVPLIFSALGYVPEHLQREDTPTAEQIVAAQPVWCELFSHWQEWRKELQEAIRRYDAAQFEERFLPKPSANSKAWTTSLVFGEPKIYGRLPHPYGSAQDKVLALLPNDTQNQIFASVMAIAS